MPTTASPPTPTDLADRLLGEGIISMSKIARMLGELKGGRPVHPSTPYRWATKGVRTKDGRVVHLESITLSGRPVSSRPALPRFLAAQQVPAPTVALPRSPATRRRDSERAGKRISESIDRQD